MERIDLKDVLHFYIGAKVKCDTLLPVFLTGIDDGEPLFGLAKERGMRFSVGSDWKLMLRRLSSITPEELRHIFKMVFNRDFPSNGSMVFIDKEDRTAAKKFVLSSGVDRLGIELTGTVWADIDLHNFKWNPHFVNAYLLSQGFDLFGLIDSGQVIELE